MATSEVSPETMDRVCAYVLRSKRAVLLRELPEVKDLVEDSRLSPLFTRYERGEICGAGIPTHRAEKFISAIENRGGRAYMLFITVLEDFRPSLVTKLNECGKEWSSRASEEFPVNCIPAEETPCNRPVPPDDNSGCVGVEEAGLFSMNDTLPGFKDDLSRLSYNGRNVLGEQLNQRETFKKFCHAMGVDDGLAIVCLRSRNPTAYLIQEIDGKPYATFSRLEQALTSIGKRAVFEQVWQLVDSSNVYD